MPRVVVVTPGAPEGPRTWSGIIRHFLRALEGRGVLAGAVNGRLAVVDMAEKAATYSRQDAKWRQKHSFRDSPLFSPARLVTTRVAERRLRHGGYEADALLQIGARHRFDRSRAGARLLCSFNDGNLALSLRRPDLLMRPSKRHIRRALDFERRVYDGLDVIFVTSEWARQSFIQDFEQDPAKVVVTFAGPNFDELPEPPARNWDRPRILFVGKHFERKGGKQLVSAFRAVHDARPDAELLLVGFPEPPPPQEGVRYIGPLLRGSGGEEPLKKLYEEATVFAMPSLYEPFGIVFLEAMSYGLPCIGSAACAMPEIIAEGETGFVVPRGDVDALAERLLELVGDPARSEAIGQAGRRRMVELFTWDAVAACITRELAARLQA